MSLFILLSRWPRGLYNNRLELHGPFIDDVGMKKENFDDIRGYLSKFNSGILLLRIEIVSHILI